MSNNVQIPQELFLDLVRYFLLEDTSETRLKAIEKGLTEKLDKLARHQTYTAYKTADTVEEQEKARQKYLEMVGIHKDFRWNT